MFDGICPTAAIPGLVPTKRVAASERVMWPIVIMSCDTCAGVEQMLPGIPAGTPGLVLETARLRLRSYRVDDLADLVALAGNWEIARWVGTIPHPYTETDGRDWIAKVQKNHATGRPRRFAIALKKTDRLIGGVGLDGSTGDGSEEPALGYWLGQPYWGNGYAREAAVAIIDYGFRTLGLETIRAYTDPDNAASQKVLLVSGLKRIGEIELLKPTHRGERRAPLFRISRPEFFARSENGEVTEPSIAVRCRT
jgi:RimJ/RimL family protein N-acetyltransferase